ncbi:testis-expressed protein 2 [Ambystoma mexicanum]|uniref:testis-expressed protein 2 n=1 Tax=Ambystoma mexicanum TaxID=8296 RepID=UPI0037E882E3
MTSLNSSHAEKKGPTSSKQAAPKVQVQRSVSRETITIHFSAFGKEEEEEEEELRETLDEEEVDDQSIVTATEAKEDFYVGPTTPLSVLATSSGMAVEDSTSLTSPSAVAPTMNIVKPLESSSLSKVFSAVPLVLSSSSQSSPLPASSAVSSPTEQLTSPSSTVSPSRAIILSSSASASPIASAKHSMSLVKSLSTDVEPRESTPPSRHRHIMKSLVKSLSTDTSKQDSETVTFKPPDSKLNLHLFKQFTQPRITGGDSKTAPSSPITSPSDARSFFKVTEVEARIEDTKRRLSEVIYEPLQLLSKIMGDESSSYRSKALSSSASELSSLSSLNGPSENNNNYSIKEEECDSEGDCPAGASTLKNKTTTSGDQLKNGDSKSVPCSSMKEANFKTPLMVLEKCSLSALASKEDEEFCELYPEDFYFDVVDESNTAQPLEILSKPTSPDDIGTDSDDESEEHVELPEVPGMTLFFFTMFIYGYIILPLPSYISGLLLGAAIGFMIAVCVIWLFTPPLRDHRNQKLHKTHWNLESLEIKEPEILKGWMNEIHNYDPETYHATLTHSVFVRLEGDTLRLSKPNKNVSRRAIYNEVKPEVTYISQKIYDLTDSKVYLVPRSLARKRVWNKKYPICIELGRQDDFMSKAQTDKESLEEKPPAERGDLAVEECKKSAPLPEGGKPGGQKEQVLYLFGRTGREKEDWFRRFLLASRAKSEVKKAASLLPPKQGALSSLSRTNSQSAILTHSRNSSKGSLDEVVPQSKPKDMAASVRQKMLLDYNVYMAKCVPHEDKSPAASPVDSAESSPTASKKLPDVQITEGEEQEAWVNALLGRMFWDFLGETYWSDLVSRKIQMKLSKIKLPYFMNELTLTELDMGVSMPKILQAFKPIVDHRGLWVDLDISYNGSFLMTLETKMNLTKLGKEPLGEAVKVGEIGRDGARPRAFCLADSDEESSSAGSSEEDDPPEVTGEVVGAEGYAGVHRTSKIMRFVDKITKSKYFQKATETEFIKKKIEEVSNTPLLLTVEVQECKGTLSVNIPPPPTDRIWYGFRKPPHLELKARPKLGERLVTFVHVTDWIEKKLDQEFQKIFVMPNMDDVYVPLMHSAMDPRSSACSPKDPIAEAADVL